MTDFLHPSSLRASLIALLLKNLPECRRPGFDPWAGKIPRRRERLPTPVSWPREFHGLYGPWGHKEHTTEQLSLLCSLRRLQLNLFTSCLLTLSSTLSFGGQILNTAVGSCVYSPAENDPFCEDWSSIITECRE